MNFSKIRFGKKQILTLIGVAAIGLTTAGPALADSANSTVPVKLNIATGGLTLSVDSSIATGGVTLGSGNIAYGAGGTASGSFAYIVDDARGEATPSGWHVTASVANFQGPSNASIDASNTTAVSSGITTIAVNGGAPQVTQENKINQPLSVLSATGANGAGRFSATMTVKLAVPQYARPGAYSSTLTLSVVTGP